MNLQNVILLTILANSSFAMGADSTDRSSPLDDNPQCMDRNNKDCVAKDDGTLRRPHLPNKVPANVNGPSGPGIAAPTMGHSATSK